MLKVNCLFFIPDVFWLSIDSNFGLFHKSVLNYAILYNTIFTSTSHHFICFSYFLSVFLNTYKHFVSLPLPIPVALPELRRNTISLDRSQPLPTSLQSDFIPTELLLALTEVSPPQEQLGPASRQRRASSVSTVNS